MNFYQELLQLDTAELSDALDACGIEGALLGIKPVVSGAKLVGPAFTVQYLAFEDQQTEFKNAGNYIDDVPEGAVIVIDNQGRDDCTSWGDILTQTAIMRSIAGTVLHGAARDVKLIRELNYPLYANAIYMRSGKNRVYKSQQECKLMINGIAINPGDMIVGDDNGVLVIPKEKLADVINKAKNIKSTEEKIVAALKEGMSLEAARKKHRYDQPWLSENEKTK